MSEFKKGQLVAVKVYSDENWEPAIFERKEGIFCICRSLLNRDAWLHRPWSKAKPAEEVWPGIFVGDNREKEIDRMHQAIGWLCGQLNRLSQDSGNCLLPAGAGIPSDDSCRVGGCEICWEQASLKAVEEDADD